ncbi:unnamed protein product [Notodromas monacha]|uniref:Abasic site processing protein HMCES n=1 Tax=Notodromas monacha TaxID=399045 RepID=A0A7R9BGA7_9CRUS|nr:unnamed protein product [Notodromas monacha]CAG0914941.1 unnamed protein product [Notodromas monacha]
MMQFHVVTVTCLLLHSVAFAAPPKVIKSNALDDNQVKPPEETSVRVEKNNEAKSDNVEKPVYQKEPQPLPKHDTPKESQEKKPEFDVNVGSRSLASLPACRPEIERLCHQAPESLNNINVLECFQNVVRNGQMNLRFRVQPPLDSLKKQFKAQLTVNDFLFLGTLHPQQNINEVLNPDCLHEAWRVKKNFTQSDTFVKAADSLCGEAFSKLPCDMVRNSIKGEFLACVIEHREAIENPQCKQFLVKLETLIFSDYHLISGFATKCDASINELKCGRLVPETPTLSHGVVIQCLMEHYEQIKSRDCLDELLRVGELQGQDYHMDRELFFACRRDADTLCHGVPSGDGKIYSCLLHMRGNERMSPECNKQLERREKLVQQHYEVSQGLAKTCHDDIKHYKCRENTSSKREIRLAQILLCLEGAMADGNPVAAECQAEILEHRRMLLEPRGLSPEILVACEEELVQTCSRSEMYKRIPRLECLMDLAVRSKRSEKPLISDNCLRQVESVLKVADAGEDWRVDPFLRESCQPVVNQACQGIQPGEGRVLQCLMQHLGTQVMTSDCEESLLRLMYFVARDFELDPLLYRSCKRDARDHCSAKEKWGGEPGSYDPERGLVVLSCLYHLALHPEDNLRLEPKCESDVRRVMRLRGKRVDLHPEIEEDCLYELANMCSQNVQPGQEILCLQEKMSELSAKCKSKIVDLTVDEDRHAEDNPYVMEHCLKAANEFCHEFVKGDAEEEDLFECLVEHKSRIAERNPKCYAAITHFQLITLEDVRFSRKFEKACGDDIKNFCYDASSKTGAKTTEQIIECLSEVALEEALTDHPMDKNELLSPKCKRQLMNQLRNEEENVKLNPRLKASCESDVLQLCPHVEEGGGRILECLKDHFPDLSSKCKNFLFQSDALAVREDRVDFALTDKCQSMIVKFGCSKRPLECLKKVMDGGDFDEDCRLVILRRMVEQSYDFRLNPALHSSCKLDIGKFCADKLVGHNKKHPSILEGEVVTCLRDMMVKKPAKLSNGCLNQLQDVVEHAAKDVRQNPHLLKVCKETIKMLCDGKGPGEVEECLKAALLAGDDGRNGIQDRKCKEEVVKIVAAEETDVHLDPVLFGSCVGDLKRSCSDVPRGEGRQLKCLLGLLKSNADVLHEDCRLKLQSRQKLFSYAEREIAKSPETLVELKNVVMHSPASNFFFLFILGVAFSVFFGGIRRVILKMRRLLCVPGLVARKEFRWKSTSSWEYCVDLVKKGDYENYLCTLLLPETSRAASFAVRAFNIEVARVAAQTKDQQRASMRLQFWKDTLEKVYSDGPVPATPVAVELKKALTKQKLSKQWLTRLIKARNTRAGDQPFRSVAEVEEYGEHVASSVNYLVLESLGEAWIFQPSVKVDHAASHLGKSQYFASLVRGIEPLAKSGLVLLPMDLMAKHGVSQEAVARLVKGKPDEKAAKGLTEIAFELGSLSHQHLQKCRELCCETKLEKKAMLGFLPGVCVAQYLISTLESGEIRKVCSRKLPDGKKELPEWKEHPGNGLFTYTPKFNTGPTSFVPILASGIHFGLDAGDRVLMPMHWGLVPRWHKAENFRAHGLTTINCRHETLLDKPLFAKPLKEKKRGVFICDGYYEWKRKDGSKQPYFLYFKQENKDVIPGDPVWKKKVESAGNNTDFDWHGPKELTVAVVFDKWIPPKANEDHPEIYSFSAITVPCHESVEFVHDRMPAILEGQDAIDLWLDPNVPAEKAVKSLKACGNLAYHKVSQFCNNIHNDSVVCVRPLTESTTRIGNQATITNFFKRKEKKDEESESPKKPKLEI